MSSTCLCLRRVKAILIGIKSGWRGGRYSPCIPGVVADICESRARRFLVSTVCCPPLESKCIATISLAFSVPMTASYPLTRAMRGQTKSSDLLPNLADTVPPWSSAYNFSHRNSAKFTDNALRLQVVRKFLQGQLGGTGVKSKGIWVSVGGTYRVKNRNCFSSFAL